MAAAAAAAGDWSQLPRDVLWSIIKRLPVSDRVRFGVVCVSWRSALAEDRCGPAPQIPWLFLRSDGTGTSGRFRFFSLTEGKEYPVRLPEIQGIRCIGSSEGFLFYADHNAELHMLDPISGANVNLPSITTFPGIEAVEAEGRIIGYVRRIESLPSEFLRVSHIRDLHFTKVILSPGSTSENYTAVAIYCNLPKKLAFARAGDEAWNVIKATDTLDFTDVIFHGGLLYASDYSGDVLSFDINDPSCPFTPLGRVENPEDEPDLMSLVVSSGELLQAHRVVSCEERNVRGPACYRMAKVSLFKRDPSSNQWVDVKSIGDHALFLGYTCSVSLSTREFPELKPNCIYFTHDNDDEYEVHYNTMQYRYYAGVYHIEDGSVDPDYPPSCSRNWPPPIWFTPTIRNTAATKKPCNEKVTFGLLHTQLAETNIKKKNSDVNNDDVDSDDKEYFI